MLCWLYMYSSLVLMSTPVLIILRYIFVCAIISRLKKMLGYYFVLDIIIISLFILNQSILVIKLRDYGTLIVYVCTIQLMGHLEPELDASLSDITYYTSCS